MGRVLDFKKHYCLSVVVPWACLAARLSVVAAAGQLPSVDLQGRRCGGVSYCRAWAPEHRLSSCGARAWLPHGIGVFLDRGSSLCLLCWQSDSLPLSPHGSPSSLFVHCFVTQSCLTPCDPMDCSTLGFLVLHCLPEFAQTYVH